MTLDEFQSIIQIGNNCVVYSTKGNENDILILNAEYRGFWNCENGQNLLHFKVIDKNWYFQIPLMAVIKVTQNQDVFADL